MWAHYADFHRGICLGFDTNNEMFGKAFKIEYSQDYPKTKFFTDSNWDRAKSQLLTKAKCWEYEQEWRLIDHVTGAGVKQFPKKALVYVIMGCEIIDENEKK
jgi:hypothetical protein